LTHFGDVYLRRPARIAPLADINIMDGAAE
jgi:hypothetical protein